MIARCEYCGSIFVCWNWFHAFNGDVDKYIKANGYETYDIDNIKMWGHECWKCENVITTKDKVTNGIPYELLRRLGKIYYWFNSGGQRGE